MLTRVQNRRGFYGLVAVFVTIVSNAEAAVEGETAYVFNTFSFLVHGSSSCLWRPFCNARTGQSVAKIQQRSV